MSERPIYAAHGIEVTRGLVKFDGQFVRISEIAALHVASIDWSYWTRAPRTFFKFALFSAAYFIVSVVIMRSERFKPGDFLDAMAWFGFFQALVIVPVFVVVTVGSYFLLKTQRQTRPTDAVVITTSDGRTIEIGVPSVADGEQVQRSIEQAIGMGA